MALSPSLWLATATTRYAKGVEAEPLTVDRYGRTVAFATVGDILVSEESIRQGLARVFNRYCDRPISEQWQRLEDEARATKRGL